MKIRCPNCPTVVLELHNPTESMPVSSLACPNCGVWVTQFIDQLGVTYMSHSLATIQRLRDETKEARNKAKSRTKGSSKGMPEWPTPTLGKTDKES